MYAFRPIACQWLKNFLSEAGICGLAYSILVDLDRYCVLSTRSHFSGNMRSSIALTFPCDAVPSFSLADTYHMHTLIMNTGVVSKNSVLIDPPTSQSLAQAQGSCIKIRQRPS